MPAGLSSVVIQLQAFFTIGLAALWLRETPRVLQLVAAGLAPSGAVPAVFAAYAIAQSGRGSVRQALVAVAVPAERHVLYLGRDTAV